MLPVKDSAVVTVTCISSHFVESCNVLHIIVLVCFKPQLYCFNSVLHLPLAILFCFLKFYSSSFTYCLLYPRATARQSSIVIRASLRQLTAQPFSLLYTEKVNLRAEHAAEPALAFLTPRLTSTLRRVQHSQSVVSDVCVSAYYMHVLLCRQTCTHSHRRKMCSPKAD